MDDESLKEVDSVLEAGGSCSEPDSPELDLDSGSRLPNGTATTAAAAAAAAATAGAASAAAVVAEVVEMTVVARSEELSGDVDDEESSPGECVCGVVCVIWVTWGPLLS